MRNLDENDKLRAGKLPKDLEAGTRLVSLPGGRPDGAEKARILTERQVLESAVAKAKQAAEQGHCTTGHWQIDEATGGIRPGYSWLFGAETNWGKSTWAVAVADENLKAGKRVLIVSAEDDESIYGSRLLARRSRVRSKLIRSGRFMPDDHEAIERCIAASGTAPVYIDGRGKSAEWIARETSTLMTNEGIDLVLFDYLQEFTSAKNHENHRLTVKHIAKTLRTVVKLAGKASVIFSQLTDSDASQKRAYPTRNMIRDCRDVANAAEVILLGYTPEKAVENSKGEVVVPAGAKGIFLDKVKDGPKGFAVWAEWDDDTASFNAVESPARRADGHEDFFDNSEDRFP